MNIIIHFYVNNEYKEYVLNIYLLKPPYTLIVTINM